MLLNTTLANTDMRDMAMWTIAASVNEMSRTENALDNAQAMPIVEAAKESVYVTESVVCLVSGGVCCEA
jgi:hypothetical protein